MNRIILLILLGIVINIVDSYVCQHHTVSRSFIHKQTNKQTNKQKVLVLYDNNNNDKRKVIGRDNLGEPIYDGDNNTSEGINVLGKKIDVDPVTSSLLIFGIIAFNFFVLANL